MTPPPIAVPAEGAGCLVVASVSGGKDSTALILALREAGIEARYVFADTGWEAPETYEYLDLLRRRLGLTIDVVRAERKDADVPDRGAFIERVRHRAGFPGRLQRWCTRELKLQPLRSYHDQLDADTISAMGVRGEESARRAAMPEWVDDDEWRGWIWRPLLRWTVEDVLTIHGRHGIPVNPLYQRGHDRVGCYPCIYSNKDEIRLIAKHRPDRIDQIRDLEREATELRAARNKDEPGRYGHARASFFQGRIVVSGPDGKKLWPVMDIDEIVSWSRTAHGGKQQVMFEPTPRGGCMRWGLCETGAGADAGDDGGEP